MLVNGTPTHYRDEGSGPVVLLLHGWGSDLSTFNNLAIWLKDKHRVVRLDLPGFGKTPFKSEKGWELNDYLKFISEFLDKIEVSKVQLVIGHSMGGRLTIKGLATRRLPADKAVLISAHGLSEKSMRSLVYAGLAKVGKFATVLLPKDYQKKLKRRLYKSAGSSDYLEVEGPMKETFKKIINEDLRIVAAQIKQPVLLLYGSRDTVTPPSMGKVFADAIHGSTYRVIQNAGHYVHLDQFGKVTEAIREFDV